MAGADLKMRKDHHRKFLLSLVRVATLAANLRLSLTRGSAHSNVIGRDHTSWQNCLKAFSCRAFQFPWSSLARVCENNSKSLISLEDVVNGCIVRPRWNSLERHVNECEGPVNVGDRGLSFESFPSDVIAMILTLVHHPLDTACRLLWGLSHHFWMLRDEKT